MLFADARTRRRMAKNAFIRAESGMVGTRAAAPRGNCEPTPKGY
jgi:hypothetical protein